MTVYLQEHRDHYDESGWKFSVFYMSNHLGTIQVEACDFCDHVKVLCEHQFNKWNEDETELICSLCGADGT